MASYNTALNKPTSDPRIKCAHMAQLADYRRETLWREPILRDLFLELTLNCNERCLHCGSRCGDMPGAGHVSLQEYKDLLTQVSHDFDTNVTRLCITGGEPLLRKDFFDIMEFAQALGFRWGLTTNGTLISPEIAQRLYSTGLTTVSVSVDGLKNSHEWFRQSEGGYERTLAGVRNLIAAANGNHVQITTCVHQRNFDELEAMYDAFSQVGITSWRVYNVEPIGRAKDNAQILLSNDQIRQLLDFVQTKRRDGNMEVLYSCSHYLGVDREWETRPWYFLCSAGLYVASVNTDGDIMACLDMERRPEIIQGNIRNDRLKDVWENKFKIFRSDFRHTGPCANCDHYQFCGGDSFHTWDFDAMEPALCLKDVAFSRRR